MVIDDLPIICCLPLFPILLDNGMPFLNWQDKSTRKTDS